MTSGQFLPSVSKEFQVETVKPFKALPCCSFHWEKFTELWNEGCSDSVWERSLFQEVDIMQLGMEVPWPRTFGDMGTRYHEDIESGPNGVTLIRLPGPLLKSDAAVALRKEVQELVSEGKSKLALDMARIADIDSSGVGTLASIYNCVREADGHVRYFGARPRVMRSLQITHLDRVLELFSDEKSALAGL